MGSNTHLLHCQVSWTRLRQNKCIIEPDWMLLDRILRITLIIGIESFDDHGYVAVMKNERADVRPCTLTTLFEKLSRQISQESLANYTDG
eukprot:4328825-Pleurochrysis_carterae.AAC.1